MAPTALPIAAQFRRVRRAALWFNRMWPGSLAQEANGYWLVHGPEGRYRLRWRTTFAHAWMMASFAPASWAPRRWGLTCRRRALIWAWLPLGAGIGSLPSRFGPEALRRRRLQYGALAAIFMGVAAVASPSSIGHHNGARDGWRAASLYGINGDDRGDNVGDEPTELASYESAGSTSGGSGGPGASGGGSNGGGPNDSGSLAPTPDLVGSEDLIDGGLPPADETTPDSPSSPPLLGGDGPQDGLTMLDSDFGGDLSGGPGTNNAGGGFGGGSGSGGGGSAGGSAGGGSGGGSTGANGGTGAGGSGGGLGGASQVIPLGILPDDNMPPSGSGGGGAGGSGNRGSGGGGSGGPPPPGGVPNGGPNGGSGGGGSAGGPTVGPTTAIPEPAVWMTLITGFGLMGALLRRRRAMAAG